MARQTVELDSLLIEKVYSANPLIKGFNINRCFVSLCVAVNLTPRAVIILTTLILLV